MTSKTKLVLAILLLLVLDGISLAKEWRGIAPLHSKREDVVRLLKQCGDAKLDCEFDFGNDHIRIVFSGDSTGDFNECSTQLPAGTVLLIEITPKTNLQFKDLRIKKKNLRLFAPSSPPNIRYRGYINDKEGLILKTYKGRVLQIDYIASVTDKHLCPSYYENPEAFIQVGLDLSPPPVAIICPTKEPGAGERITISAETIVDPKTSFTWTLSAGKIVKGQGTPVIIVDISGLEGQAIVATVNVHGAAASCEVRISPK